MSIPTATSSRIHQRIGDLAGGGGATTAGGESGGGDTVFHCSRGASSSGSGAGTSLRTPQNGQNSLRPAALLSASKTWSQLLQRTSIIHSIKQGRNDHLHLADARGKHRGHMRE